MMLSLWHLHPSQTWAQLVLQPEMALRQRDGKSSCCVDCPPPCRPISRGEAGEALTASMTFALTSKRAGKVDLEEGVVIVRCNFADKEKIQRG